jgi:hypothetical protein
MNGIPMRASYVAGTLLLYAAAGPDRILRVTP